MNTIEFPDELPTSVLIDMVASQGYKLTYIGYGKFKAHKDQSTKIKRIGCEGVGDNNGFFEISAEKDLPKLKNLLHALDRINGWCIGEVAMGYKIDAESIGEIICKATGMTAEELTAYCKQHNYKSCGNT